MTLTKRIAALCLTVVLLISVFIVGVCAEQVSSDATIMVVSPATETIINGQPESQIPMLTDVIMGPYFYQYQYNQKTTVNKFRQIATFTHDNRLNDSAATMEAQVTRSEAQGSEWNTSCQLTADIKNKIIAALKAQVGISYKSSRSTNEAVGYKVTHTVPAGKVGHISLYYRGYKIGGKVTVWTANTMNPTQSKRYSTYTVESTLYPSQDLDIYSESYNANY